MAITYFESSYGFPEKEVVVFEESYMAPAPEGIEGLSGIWEYFDVHEPVDEVHTYGVDENGFLFRISDTYLQLCSERECKINGKWYKRADRLKPQA